jgi:hypothetical protein
MGMLPGLVAAFALANACSGGGSGCFPGTASCYCYNNGTCDDGLSCQEGVCVASDAGAAGTAGLSGASGLGGGGTASGGADAGTAGRAGSGGDGGTGGDGAGGGAGSGGDGAGGTGGTGGAGGTGGNNTGGTGAGGTGGNNTGGTGAGGTGGTGTGGSGTGGWTTSGGSTSTGGQPSYCGDYQHIAQYDQFTQGIVLTFEPPSGQTLNMTFMPNNNEDWVGGVYGYVDGTCACTSFTVQPSDYIGAPCPCGNIQLGEGQGVSKAGAADSGNAMKLYMQVKEWGGGWIVWMECFDVTQVPFTGVTFWAKRNTPTSFSIEPSLAVPETALPSQNGTCPYATEWGGSNCSFTHPAVTITETWTQFKLPFSAFVKKNITGEVSLDKIKSFQVQINNPSYGNQFTAELLVDNWGFYKE